MTVILSLNDAMAVGACGAAGNGMRVPQGLSVNGFDNIDLDLIGKTICDVLISGQDATLVAQHIVIDPELVARGSTRPAPR
ncbi:MAG TPA: hypothetical protein VMB03_02460 [Bryobacteraceae bacterium]|nr:hypothetical protein [Bryobacteraceae bacterium]